MLSVSRAGEANSIRNELLESAEIFRELLVQVPELPNEVDFTSAEFMTRFVEALGKMGDGFTPLPACARKMGCEVCGRTEAKHKENYNRNELLESAEKFHELLMQVPELPTEVDPFSAESMARFDEARRKMEEALTPLRDCARKLGCGVFGMNEAHHDCALKLRNGVYDIGAVYRSCNLTAPLTVMNANAKVVFDGQVFLSSTISNLEQRLREKIRMARNLIEDKTFFGLQDLSLPANEAVDLFSTAATRIVLNGEEKMWRDIKVAWRVYVHGPIRAELIPWCGVGAELLPFRISAVDTKSGSNIELTGHLEWYPLTRLIGRQRFALRGHWSTHHWGPHDSFMQLGSPLPQDDLDLLRDITNSIQVDGLSKSWGWLDHGPDDDHASEAPWSRWRFMHTLVNRFKQLSPSELTSLQKTLVDVVEVAKSKHREGLIDAAQQDLPWRKVSKCKIGFVHLDMPDLDGGDILDGARPLSQFLTPGDSNDEKGPRIELSCWVKAPDEKSN